MTVETRLLDDRYAPITSEIGFLECDAKTAVDAFQAWQGPIQAARGVHFDRREIVGGLPEKLTTLLPLTSVEARRFLLLPTTSNWTAYLDNGWRGTDVFSAVSYLAQMIGCRGVRATSVPHTSRKTATGSMGRFGATILEVYAAKSEGRAFLNIQRSISAAHDGSRWRFDANGEILAFEQPERYEAKQIRERFTAEMLGEYLCHLGIHCYSAEFYEPSKPAILVTKVGPVASGLKEYSLDDARASF